MQTIEIDVANRSGLHARPAATFVKKAASFRSDIRVENLTRTTKPASAKSLLGVLGCGVEQGHRIRVTAEGEDEEAAIEALRVLAEGGFGEATQA
ncbi:MAG: HPr family phosphocarrier protein [Candidatus Limnocylindrales bacterium]|jgi:phosphotransferase system HPr (HPr) family protein